MAPVLGGDRAAQLVPDALRCQSHPGWTRGAISRRRRVAAWARRRAQGQRGVQELWSAVQIRAGVSGMSRWVTPYGDSASTAAFTTAGGAPMQPASPTPLAPRGLRGEGVQVFSISTSGTSSARGTAYSISVPVTS